MTIKESYCWSPKPPAALFGKNILIDISQISSAFTKVWKFTITQIYLEVRIFPGEFEDLKEMADYIIIDEGHHFRNPGTWGKTGYWKLADICQNKKVIFLTATPINNSLRDLQHMIEIFTGGTPDYFKQAPLGIYSLSGHFKKLENDLEKIMGEKQTGETEESDTDQAEAQKVLLNDALFQELVVQRSRAYVRKEPGTE